MAILDKLMFWKKKDEFADMGLGDKDNLAFGDDFGAGLQNPGMPKTPGMPGSQFGLSQPQQGFGQDNYGQGADQGYGRYPQSPAFSNPQPSFSPQFSQPRYDNPQGDINSKNLEIISSKLDALRASIESLSQRLANIEAIARGEEDQGRRRRYY